MKINPVYSLLVMILSCLYLAGCSRDVPESMAFTQIPAEFHPTVTLPASLPTAHATATPTPIGRSIFGPFPAEFHKNTIMTLFWFFPAGINGGYGQVFVDNTLGNITFSLAWEGAEADTVTLSLAQPDGTILDVSTKETADFSHRSDSRYIEYAIDDPQPGEWTMMTSSEYPVDIPYEIEVYSTESPMQVVLLFDDEDEYVESIEYDEKRHLRGDCIKLTAWVQDLVSLPGYKSLVHGSNFIMTVKDPQGAEYDFHLYDDGQHGDRQADDGIHASDFCDTQTAGQYLFYLQIGGTTNWYPDHGVEEVPFTREFIRSTTVY